MDRDGGNTHIEDPSEFQKKAGELFGKNLLIRAELDDVEKFEAVKMETKRPKRREKLNAYYKLMKTNDPYWDSKKIRKAELRQVIELSKIRPGFFVCSLLLS